VEEEESGGTAKAGEREGRVSEEKSRTGMKVIYSRNPWHEIHRLERWTPYDGDREEMEPKEPHMK